MYEVLRRIWHTWDERTYEPGAIVSLGHLENDDIKRLIKSGTVRKVVTKPIPRPVPKPVPRRKKRVGTRKGRVTKKKVEPKKAPEYKVMEEVTNGYEFLQSASVPSGSL